MIGLLMLPACQEDDKQIPPSEIQFRLSLQNITEGDEATIVLTLDKPSPVNVSIELTLETNAIYDQHFVTDPGGDNNSVFLNVSKGQESVDLKVTSINNTKYEGARFIIFKLQALADGLRLGAATTCTLIIGDDEGPSVANFALNSALLKEKDANGIVVLIPLSAPARGEGRVTVFLDAGQAVDKINFTIDRELDNNAISLNVLPNATSVSFKVFPVDNDLSTGNFVLSFSIAEVSGVVQKGNGLRYSLTLLDDELPSVAKFAMSAGTVPETNADGVVVAIQLSSPVKGEGRILIELSSGSASYGVHFTTLPAMVNNIMTLSLSHDQTGASFTVYPVDNGLFTDGLIGSFKIARVEGVVRTGTSDLSYQLTIIDDEQPSIANFALASASIDEIKGDGMEVEIQFSNPAAGTGKITVQVEEYNDNFTSNPGGEEIYEYYDYDDYSYHYSYQITLDVARYAQRTSFKVLPLDHTHCTKDGIIKFRMGNVSGVIRKGENQTFDLTVKADVPVTATLKEKAGTLNDSDTSGKEIILDFSQPAMRDGSIIVSLGLYNNYHTGTYTTVPVMLYSSGSGDYASLNFQKNDNSVLVKVFPINDNVARGNIPDTFHFYPGGSDNGCVTIPDGTKYTLTVVDDD